MSNVLVISLPSTRTYVLDVGRTDGLLIVGLLIAYRSIRLLLRLSLRLVLGALLRALLRVLLGVLLRVWFRVLLIEALVASSLESLFRSRVLVERLLGISFCLFASLPYIFL